MFNLLKAQFFHPLFTNLLYWARWARNPTPMGLGYNLWPYTNQFFLSPIINNYHSLIIFMWVLLCFSYYLGNLTFAKSMLKCFIKPTIYTITSMYFSFFFFPFFLKLYLWVIKEILKPWNSLYKTPKTFTLYLFII